MSRKIKILIASSLVLNILLIGFLMGNMSHRFYTGDSFRKKQPELSVKLSPEKEELFLDTMRRVRRENRDIHVRMKEAREKIFAVLVAPEFNENAYESEVGKLHEMRGLVMQRYSNATKELAKQLNQEEREALAVYLRDSARSRRSISRDNRPQ
jgi:uncharacterized membrane protein